MKQRRDWLQVKMSKQESGKTPAFKKSRNIRKLKQVTGATGRTSALSPWGSPNSSWRTVLVPEFHS